MKHTNETFPTAMESVFLIIAQFGIGYLVGAALVDCQSVIGVDVRQVPGAIILISNGILLSLIMAWKGWHYRELLHPTSGSPLRLMGLTTVPLLLLVPALLLAVKAVNTAVVSYFPPSGWEQQLFEQFDAADPVMVLTICVIGPVVEEMLFRGVILRSFLAQYRSEWAILGSAALFGAAHMNIYQGFTGLAIGVILGWLYTRTRSVLPGMLLHVAYNTAVLITSSLDSHVTLQSPSSTAVWIIAFLSAAVSFTWLERKLSHLRS